MQEDKDLPEIFDISGNEEDGKTSKYSLEKMIQESLMKREQVSY